MCHTLSKGNQRAKGGLPSCFREGLTLQTKAERRALSMNITYPDLIQFCVFVVALVSLCYQIFKDKRK